jgi:hypothetical protein
MDSDALQGKAANATPISGSVHHHPLAVPKRPAARPPSRRPASGAGTPCQRPCGSQARSRIAAASRLPQVQSS